MSASPKSKPREKHLEIPQNVIAASRKMFLHFGVHRATMADISREIGMPRQTLYEYVSSRDELVEAVLIQRIREIAEGLDFLDADSFAEAFVDASVAAIRTARCDRELLNLVATGPKDLVQKVVVGGCQETHDIVRGLFDSILDRGIKSGQLRKDKSRDELIDWFRIVFLALIIQTDIEPKIEHSIISDFLLSSVMFTPPPGRSKTQRRRPAS